MAAMPNPSQENWSVLSLIPEWWQVLAGIGTAIAGGLWGVVNVFSSIAEIKTQLKSHVEISSARYDQTLKSAEETRKSFSRETEKFEEALTGFRDTYDRVLKESAVRVSNLEATLRNDLARLNEKQDDQTVILLSLKESIGELRGRQNATEKFYHGS
jgi:hypothetical protein